FNTRMLAILGSFIVAAIVLWALVRFLPNSAHSTIAATMNDPSIANLRVLTRPSSRAPPHGAAGPAAGRAPSPPAAPPAPAPDGHARALAISITVCIAVAEPLSRGERGWRRWCAAADANPGPLARVARGTPTWSTALRASGPRRCPLSAAGPGGSALRRRAR